MPSPNSDEFHIAYNAYIYLNIMFDQGPWDHATFHCLTRPPLLPVVKDLPAQPVFVSRTLGPTMHRQQLGPTMSGSTVVVMQNDVWINMRLEDFFRLFQNEQSAGLRKMESLEMSWRYPDRHLEPMLINVAIDFGCHEHHSRTSDRLRLPELPEVCSRSFTCEGH